MGEIHCLRDYIVLGGDSELARSAASNKCMHLNATVDTKE